jgi:pyruvate-formate lyase-activating enzyme
MLYTNPDNAFLFPSEEAMEEARKNHNDGKPLIQVNLLSYHKTAKYEDESLNTISGEEAYKKYAKVAMKAVTKSVEDSYGIPKYD